MIIEPCKFCGWEAHAEWGDGEMGDFYVECNNSINCKQWPRIYVHTKTHAIRLWNLMMKNEEKQNEKFNNS